MTTVLQLGDGVIVRTVDPPARTLTAIQTPAPATAPKVLEPSDVLTGISVYVPASTTGASPQAFAFATPAATWTVPHGLGRNPMVQLVDDAGAVIDADIDFPDPNTVVVTHAQPLAGSVLLI